MKLVEILARELGEWPDGAAVAVQDLDEGVYFNESARSIEYESEEMGEWSEVNRRSGWIDEWRTASVLATDHATAIVTREMWEAERAKLNRGVEWGGEELPPSGTDIEYLSYLGKWKKGRYLGEFGGRSVCGDYETGAVGYVEGIRPMCTAELIAAEERERVLDDIYRIIRNAGRPGNKADMAEALYDAGYRKQEKD